MIQKKKCTKCLKDKALNQFELLGKWPELWLSRKCRLCKETKKHIQTGLVNLKIELLQADYDSIRNNAIRTGFSPKNYILWLHRKNMEK